MPLRIGLRRWPIVSYVDTVLKPLFSNPAIDVSLRWTNQQAEEAKARSSMSQPDAIISHFKQLAAASTMGHMDLDMVYQRPFSGRPFVRSQTLGPPPRQRPDREIRCYNCEGKGHLSKDCPSSRFGTRNQQPGHLKGRARWT